MRRLTKIAAASAVLALALTACANDTNTASEEGLCDGGGDGPKVGLAYDVGGRGDQSFNDSAARGMEQAKDELDATCTEAEAQDGEPESAREDRLRTLAEDGHNPIIGTGFAYSLAVDAVAPDFPEVSFGVIDGFDPTPDEVNDNVAYLGFAEHEGSFLVGVAAALKTQTDHVGFVGGVHNDLIKKFEAGYAAGVEAVNPDIKVDVTYIEEEDLKGFNDPAGGKAAAAAMYENGADIVYHASGGSGSGVFDAAVEAGDGMWAIGVDSDQYLTASEDQKEHILTSMLKRVDTATFNMVQSVADGEPLSGYQSYDLKADGVGYSTSGGFIDDITDQIDEWAEKIKSGEVKVPSTVN
nr:BMP family ABC transporter substrate-binding protein [uncultured Nocardioides sp.]